MEDKVYNEYGMVSVDPAKADRFYANDEEKRQLVQSLLTDRFNESCARAHHRHGDRFMENYNAVTSQPVDAMSQAMVARIFNSEDPGEAVMHFGENPFSRPPPFLHASSPYRHLGPSPRQSRARAPRDDAGGWGDAYVEDDIFRSAFDDSEGWQY
jgi:hypothetical protein